MNIDVKKHLANFITLLLFLSVSFSGYSQDGEKLFKANCASCHHPVKNATGPKMQGVLQKWEDNGEGELIYDWVKNPAELYNSGKSKMAKAIWDWSPTVMTPQGHLSKDEVKSIFAYVDAYAPPVAADGGAASDDTIYEAEDDSVSFWWWIIIGLLVLEENSARLLRQRKARKLTLKKLSLLMQENGL